MANPNAESGQSDKVDEWLDELRQIEAEQRDAHAIFRESIRGLKRADKAVAWLTSSVTS